MNLRHINSSCVNELRCYDKARRLFTQLENSILAESKLRFKKKRITKEMFITGDSQVSYLYAIRKFNFTEVEYSVYGTINMILGLFGTLFCISILSKKYDVQDSVIGGLAGVSRIASCFVLTFAPNRTWYYVAPIFNIFSSSGLTAVRSIATKSVPNEEVAKLSSIMGVMEALAPSIYMPTSSLIYVSTIEDLPGAFYLFDAALTVLALGLFTVIYVLVRKRNKVTVSDPGRKEEYARTNEISRF